MFLCFTLAAQTRPDPPATVIAAQRAAMAPLAAMDGVWRGPAATVLENGQKHEVTQTERIGFFEMNLKRVGARDWPAAGAVPMK